MSTAFAPLGLIDPLLRALDAEGYQTPTPIQARTIPHVLEGRDVLGCAQTGTGKTAAFALPILDRLSRVKPRGAGSGKRGNRPIRALVLSPTRELAAQIGESFETYGRHTPIRQATIFGGVNQNKQTDALRRGVDVLVATPGRLMDLMQQGFIDLGSIETFVLDEADRMLDMGFIPDIRRIAAKLPTPRQTLLFSATMPRPIRAFANEMLGDPVEIEIAPESTPAERVDQFACGVEKPDKLSLLLHLLETTSISRAIVFTRTKHGADRVASRLGREGFAAAAIHGNKTQAARVRTLDNFRSARTPILVATDVAARGIDIDDVSHVFNFDLPKEPETYVHRIGRTARAGASGTAIAFVQPDERHALRAIESLMGSRIQTLEHGLTFPPRAEPSGGGQDQPGRSDGSKGTNGQAGNSGGRAEGKGRKRGPRPTRGEASAKPKAPAGSKNSTRRKRRRPSAA